MRKALGFALILILSAFIKAGDLQITGYVRNYTGVLLHGDYDFSIVQNTLNLNFELKSDRAAFKVNPYIYHYYDRDVEFDVREAYLDLYFNSMDIRIGKQQIIWGKADGVFITDVISPKDLSEFLLRDFDEIRMGITAAKIDYYIGNSTLELVWVPVFTPDKIPPEGSIWRPKMDLPPNATFDFSKKDVAFNLKNSEVFGKLSTLTGPIDFEIMAGYTWDSQPTPFMEREIDPITHMPISITIVPQYDRLTLFGGSFSTTIKGIVFRGEGAYYMGKYFQTTDPTVPEGVVEKNYLHYLIGADASILGAKVSVQFIQRWIFDYEPTLVSPERHNMMTVLVTNKYLNDTLTLEFFSYIGLTDGDALIRPKITYSFSDGFDIQFGANIFTGSKGMFGQFNDNDMIYTKIRYSF